MLQSTLLFFSYAAHLAAQAGDCYTTQVGLNNKMVESNPIGKFLFNKIGTTATFAIKMGALPLVPSFVLACFGAYDLANIFNFTIAAVTSVVAVHNLMLLKKAKIKIF